VRAEGTKRFAAPRDEVYAALNDPERLGLLVPGVHRVDVRDARHWTVEARLPLGVTTLRIEIHFVREEERPPEHARLTGSGRSRGASIDVDTTFDLAERDGGTDMSWRAEANVGGAMGRLGGAVLGPAFEHQIGRVLAALDRELAAA
jgi:carbon monoxide dehydrogenase subunit G